MRRGRPPHPDLLTPREEEVLALLREGLTNEQIAQRLGISRFGAKYHVSEILSKLGVASREEASAWQPDVDPEPRRRRLFAALPFGGLPGISLGAATKTAVAGALVAAGAGVTLLAAGVIAMNSRADELAVPPAGAGLAGSRLAFVQDGNLWVRDLPDGPAVQLTSAGTASHPRWSSSGEWVIAGLEVMGADGSERRQAPLCHGWSPVADELTCIVDDRGSYDAVRIERPDGAVVRVIEMADLAEAAMLALEVETVSCADWSTDGALLACRVEGARPPAPGIPEDVAGAYSRYSGLWVVEADGSGARELVDNFEVPDDYGAIGIVGWSADNASVLFHVATAFSGSISSDGLRLYSVPVQGGPIVKVQGTLLSRDELQDWQHAGPTIAVTEGGGRETWTQKRIALADLASGDLRYLTQPEEAAFSPELSPDGGTIAYVAAPDVGRVGGGDLAREGAAQRRIWLMNADGSGKRQLTDSAAYRDERPQWSADGRHIMFARLDSEDRASLWVMPAAGGTPVELAVVSRASGTAPDVPLWFGFYGYIAWDAYYDWWQP